MMRTITISDEDAQQIFACLMTMSEISDAQINQSLEVAGRLQRDQPEAAADTIRDLNDQVLDFETDSDNLKRIALIFN